MGQRSMFQELGARLHVVVPSFLSSLFLECSLAYLVPAAPLPCSAATLSLGIS